MPEAAEQPVAPRRARSLKNPVDSVSWDDCQELLKKLNALGKEPGGPASYGGLPRCGRAGKFRFLVEK